MDSVKNSLFVSGLLIWTVATSCYFVICLYGFWCIAYSARRLNEFVNNISTSPDTYCLFTAISNPSQGARELGRSLWNR